MLGVTTVSEGLKRAADVGLDLVEISPNANPPVCKVLDYGKYKYEAKKRAQEAKKKQKTIQLKEVKFRPNIGENDFQVKLKNIRKFLSSGDKVKVSLRFKGREIVHNDLAREIFERIITEVEELGKPELRPKLEGKQMMMILVANV